MSNLYAMSIAVDEVVDISKAPESLGISNIKARMLKNFLGLQSVSYCKNLQLEDLMLIATQKAVQENINPEKIDYAIFTHTSHLIAPFAYGVLHRVVSKLKLKNAKYFGLSLNKCASCLESFQLIDSIFKADEAANHILLISGDRSFTGQHRQLNNASVAGDAAAAALFSRDSIDPGLELITTSKIVEPKYCKGEWLNRDEANKFEIEFPKLMAKVINNSLQTVNLDIDKLKFILPHNVNLPIWNKISDELQIDGHQIYKDNISKYGHCFSTDTLLNIDSVYPRLVNDEYILAATVGYGLTFVSAIFRKHDGIVK